MGLVENILLKGLLLLDAGIGVIVLGKRLISIIVPNKDGFDQYTGRAPRSAPPFCPVTGADVLCLIEELGLLFPMFC